MTAPNFPRLRERSSGSISSFVRGYQPVSTSLLFGVKRRVMHSTVRSAPDSSVAAASSSAPYSSRQPATGIIGAIVSPTG